MNRCSKFVLACLVATAAFAAVAVADPVPGTYTSTDLGGALFTGRASQSWGAALNANQGNGDVFHAESWSGSALGTQWTFSCGTQTAPQIVQDNRVGGTGTVVFTNSFLGGSFNFVNGPWCNSANCGGTTSQTVSTVTVQYVTDIPVASVVNINTSGVFPGTNCNLTFVISNGVGLGDTDSGSLPADYPAFLETDCSASRVFGSWGDVVTIVARIDCPTSTHNSTWGALKSSYR